MKAAVELRLATDGDLQVCAEIWRDAIADYERRLGRPIVQVELGPVLRILEHLRATDPDRFWVAERAGSGVVGFGAAVVRGPLWYLAMLFVLPTEQRRGIGRALLERTRRALDAGAILATATDSAQPVSNAMYARLGIVPRMPVWNLGGRLERPDALPPLPTGTTAEELPADGTERMPVGLADALASIDRSVYGFDRPQDHARWRSDGRRGFLYRDAAGTPIAYGYATPVGRVGPVAATAPELLAPLVGHLLRTVPPRGSSVIYVPGAAGELFRALLEAGFRLDGFPALACWTEPYAAHDRACPGALALP